MEERVSRSAYGGGGNFLFAVLARTRAAEARRRRLQCNGAVFRRRREENACAPAMMILPPALRLLLAGATLLTGLASSRNVLQRKRKAGVTAVQVDNDGAITKLEDHGCFLRGMADGAEYTASLNCPDLGLAGTIPAAISELTLLTSLFLNANALTGTIPPALGKLTRLETLARPQHARSLFTFPCPT